MFGPSVVASSLSYRTAPDTARLRLAEPSAGVARPAGNGGLALSVRCWRSPTVLWGNRLGLDLPMSGVGRPGEGHHRFEELFRLAIEELVGGESFDGGHGSRQLN